MIEIQNNWTGIPESLRAKIFEPFYTTKEEGSGLGLSIAKKITEAHYGTLTFHSRKARAPLSPNLQML